MKKALLFISLAIAITAINMANAQTYDPYAVQVINNLIANNGLQATPNAPETWGFATWNDEKPKKIIELDLKLKSLSGTASFAGLTSLKKLLCWGNNLKGVDVTNCTALQELQCQHNGLGEWFRELILTNCKQLQYLRCAGSGSNLSELDLSGFTQLQTLICYSGPLSKLNVKGCPQLQHLSINDAKLIELDLTGLNKLTEFLDMDQRPRPIILYKNKDDEYTCPIMLNNPTFTNSAISYSDGILKSTDKTVGTTYFTVQTNKKGFILEGWLTFIYSNGDINEYDSLAVTRINDLIANNGLNAKPNAPETWWEFTIWNNEMPKQLVNLSLGNFLFGDVTLSGLSSLESLNCSSIEVTECDVTGCSQLTSLFIQKTKLSKLEINDCTKLEFLNCCLNKLTELDLTGLDNLKTFYGLEQEISLTLHKNEAGEYTCAVPLQDPIFSNSAISYFDGILKSTDKSATSTQFTVKTIGNKDFKLSGEMKFTYSNVGIESTDNKSINIYPNPTTGELIITNFYLRITNVEVYDVNGKKQIAECRVQQVEREMVIDISHFPAGVYLVKVITEQGEITKKIVKQ